MDCKDNSGVSTHQKGDRPLECEKCLEYLNVCRLMIEPRTDSITSNQTVAVNYSNKLIHEMTLQEIFMFQKRFEALAAQCSYVYSTRTITERVPDPKELERKKEDWAQAVKEQKDKQRPAKEKKILTDRDKAIEALIGVGVPREAAIASVDERMKSMGRVAQ